MWWIFITHYMTMIMRQIIPVQRLSKAFIQSKAHVEGLYSI